MTTCRLLKRFSLKNQKRPAPFSLGPARFASQAPARPSTTWVPKGLPHSDPIMDVRCCSLRQIYHGQWPCRSPAQARSIPHLHLTAHGDSPDLTAAPLRPCTALNLSLRCRLCHCAGVPWQQAAGTLTIPTPPRPDRRTRPATPHMTRGQQRTPPA